MKPTKEEIAAAAGKTLPDVLAAGLDVLFCGINAGLYTAAVGHHFVRPGNRFWPALYGAGFTPRLFNPSEQRDLLPLGCGITNLVARATTAADELTAEELAGRRAHAGAQGAPLRAALPRGRRHPGVPHRVRAAAGEARIAGGDDRRDAHLGPAESERPQRALPAGELVELVSGKSARAI